NQNLKQYDTQNGTTYFQDFKSQKLNKDEKMTCYTYLNAQVSDTTKKKRIQTSINSSYFENNINLSLEDIRSSRNNTTLHQFINILNAIYITNQNLKQYDTQNGTTYSQDFKSQKLNKDEKMTCYTYLNAQVSDATKKSRIQSS